VKAIEALIEQAGPELAYIAILALALLAGKLFGLY